MNVKESKMNVKTSLLLASTMSLMVLLPSNHVLAKDDNQADTKQEHKSYRASKKVPAMRNRVYTQLARAQKLADEGDKAAGFEVLSEVESRLNNLNGYEQAMLYNFYGFMYYANDNVEKAIDSFTKVIGNETAIPNSLLISTRYTLAQLSMQKQDFAGALTHLKQWQKANDKPLTSNQEMLFAQVYYQDKQYVDSLIHIENAVSIAQEANKPAKENWLVLQRATLYELNKPKQVTKVMEQLVSLYSKPQYWLQLASMYGEVGEEEKQVAVMEAAYQAGYITKSSEIITLAQLYQFHGAPFKAAKLLNEAIAQGIVVPKEQNLDLLARAYLGAKEPSKAIKVLKELSKIVEHGKYDALLSQTYLNTEKWKQAIMHADEAIARSHGDNSISYLGNMYLAKGMANFNLKKFNDSLSAFVKAEKLPKIKKTAQQWAKYVEREQEAFQRYQQLKLVSLN
jgi:tetratricopeptide (TPR) repeat protein